MFRKYRVAAIGALLFINSSAMANLVTYEGLGPANTWESWGNWFGNFSGISSTIAQKFTATVSGNFEELYASIVPDSMTPNRTWTLKLLSDQSNSPGSVLWETTSTTWPVPQNTVFHLEDLNGPMLTAGASYWIQALNPSDNSMHYWNVNDQGYNGTFASSYDEGATWSVSNEDARGLRVLVSAIPEPMSLSLLALSGLTGVMVLRRRSRST